MNAVHSGAQQPAVVKTRGVNEPRSTLLDTLGILTLLAALMLLQKITDGLALV